jgi:hypothetical protein
MAEEEGLLLPAIYKKGSALYELLLERVEPGCILWQAQPLPHTIEHEFRCASAA